MKVGNAYSVNKSVVYLYDKLLSSLKLFFFLGESEAGCSTTTVNTFWFYKQQYCYFIEVFDCTGSDGPSEKLKLRLISMCKACLGPESSLSIKLKQQ